VSSLEYKGRHHPEAMIRQNVNLEQSVRVGRFSPSAEKLVEIACDSHFLTESVLPFENRSRI
jgi:hypothetical protein